MLGLELNLPKRAVSRRATVVRPIEANQRVSYAYLEGPGCIHHIFCNLTHPQKHAMNNRKIVIRIYFDDNPVPYVEAPVGDFFGIMHGESHYDINNLFLSVKQFGGHNCYFPMPFARSARIELETGPEPNMVYLFVNWHYYPDQELEEPLRFCASWRRECPSTSNGTDFLVADIDGPGRFLGYACGIRLLDDENRWSHGTADTFYIDGEGPCPSLMRGHGGEGSFGAGYGGNIHPPDTHLFEGIPYYVHEDVGQSRPAPRMAGYRFYVHDAIWFEESLQLRYGTMRNDICATAYWYQTKPRRPISRIPDWRFLTSLQARLLPGEAEELFPNGAYDLPMPDHGSWSLVGPFPNPANIALKETLPAEKDPQSVEWTRLPAQHGFIDFHHLGRPQGQGCGMTYVDVVGLAHCILHVPQACRVKLQLAWDDHLILQINQGETIDLGDQAIFQAKTIEVPLMQGDNTVLLKLSNMKASTDGGWVFAFKATLPDGTVIYPQAILAEKW